MLMMVDARSIGVIFDAESLRVWKVLDIMVSFVLIFESIIRCESWFLLRHEIEENSKIK